MVENKIMQGTEEYRLADKKLEEILNKMYVHGTFFLENGSENDANSFIAYSNNFGLIGENLEDFPIELVNYFDERKEIIEHYFAGEITLKEARKYWDSGFNS